MITTIITTVAMVSLSIAPRAANAQVSTLTSSSLDAAPLITRSRARSDTAVHTSSTLFTRRDAWIAGTVIASTAAVMPFDNMVADRFSDPGPQRSAFLHTTGNAFNRLGDPGVLVLGLGTFGVGRLACQRRVAELGLRATEAIVVSGAVTGLIKGVTGRGRPATSVNDPDTYRLFGGFSQGGYTSFPSGHTTAAFAAAAVVSEESAQWWPGGHRYVMPAAYGGAALVGMARLYTNHHWASDVLAGAAIGTLSGIKVVQFHRTHPHTFLDRWLLSTDLAPGGRGLNVSWRIGAP